MKTKRKTTNGNSVYKKKRYKSGKLASSLFTRKALPN